MTLMTKTETVCEFKNNATNTVSVVNKSKSKEHFAKKLIRAYVLLGKTI